MTRFEVVARDDTRWPVRGRRPLRWRPALFLLPATVLVGVVLVLPLGWTVITSLREPSAYLTVLRDGRARHAVVDSLIWLLLAPVLCLAGLALAWLGRRCRFLGVIAAPIAVPALGAGVAFRLLAGPDGMASRLGVGVQLLGPGWVWLVLGLAFAWQWMGLGVVVFRDGLAAVPASLLRMARAFGVGRWRRLGTVTAPALFPVAALVLLIVLVATTRVFDLILVTVPGSIQDKVDVVGLFWWRSRQDLGAGEAAALTVLPFLVVALAALAGLWGLFREWPSWEEEAETGPAVGDAAATWRSRVFTALAVAVWALPLLALVATSWHLPAAASGGAWWAGGFGLDSYREAFASGELAHALLNTGARAVLAVLLILVVAVPAAYALAFGGLDRRLRRGLIVVTTVLAVTPPQTVIVALGQVFDRLRLLGAPTALTVVHAAFGVPLAVLLLRAAFASVPRDVVRARQLDPDPGAALFAAVRESAPAVVTVAVMGFVLVWNDFGVGLLLGGPESGQVALVLFQQARLFASSASVLAASTVIAASVPLILVLVTGRWLVRGLSRGVRRASGEER